MLFFLSADFWIGVAVGAAFSPLWVKVGAWLWSLFAKKAPTAAADVQAVADVAAPAVNAAVAAAEAAVPPATPPAK